MRLRGVHCIPKIEFHRISRWVTGHSMRSILCLLVCLFPDNFEDQCPVTWSSVTIFATTDKNNFSSSSSSSPLPPPPSPPESQGLGQYTPSSTTTSWMGLLLAQSATTRSTLATRRSRASRCGCSSTGAAASCSRAALITALSRCGPRYRRTSLCSVDMRIAQHCIMGARHDISSNADFPNLKRRTTEKLNIFVMTVIFVFHCR